MAGTRVLVTGASGLLGRAVMKEFSSNSNWNVLGLAFSRTQGGLRKCDLTKKEEVEEVLQDFKPTFVVHCAAERRPDVVDKKEEATAAINVTATRHLTQLADAAGAVLVFMSTDYVFDGRNPPYQVDSPPNPLNKYGKSKLEGENVVLGINKKHMVVRVPIMYGPVENLDESAVTVIFKQVCDSGTPYKVCHHLCRYPTHTADVAAVLHQLLGKRLQDSSLTGIFHWSGSEMLTKYDMAVAMGAECGRSTDHLTPHTQPPAGAERPHDAHLDTGRLCALGIQHHTAFQQAIPTCLQPYIPSD